jgi:hypothetical protein
MFKIDKDRVVIVSPTRSRAIESLLLPNGGRAVLVDRGVHERALHAADEMFEQTVRQMKVRSEHRGRERAA